MLNAMMHTIISEGLVDENYVSRYTSGFEELKANLEDYPPEKVAPICGIPRDSTNRSNLFWRIIFKIGFQFFETTGVAGNIIFIYQAFGNDGVHHRVQHRHIGIRIPMWRC